MLEATRAVFRLVGSAEQIDRFFLVGGTALSLHEHHRLSEDLDFVVPSPRLPARAVEQIIDRLHAQGAQVEQVVNVALQQEFEDSGLDVNDYQRDYAVDGVKVTFFAAGTAESAVLVQATPAAVDGVRVADTQTLFRLKALLLTERVTSRDLFDLYYFATRKDQGVDAIFDVIRQFHPTYPLESVKHRLISSPLRPDDPGFESLISEDITPEGIRSWFQLEVDEWESREAQRIADELEPRDAPPSPSPFD